MSVEAQGEYGVSNSGFLSGARAVEVVRSAMTDAGIAAAPVRANLIGHFCNRWNAAVAQAGDDDAGGPLREGWQIMVGPGHSGYGVYAVFAEYPDEGSVCLCNIEQVDVGKVLEQGAHPADQLGAFARWYIGENGHAPDHRYAEVVQQFKVWCAARA